MDKNEMKVCPKCGWYDIDPSHREKCDPAAAAVADRIAAQLPDIKSTKLGWGDGVLTFEIGSELKVGLGLSGGRKRISFRHLHCHEWMTPERAITFVRALAIWHRRYLESTVDYAYAIEKAVDVALSEVARQQGGIADPIGYEARVEGIAHGRRLLEGLGRRLAEAEVGAAAPDPAPDDPEHPHLIGGEFQSDKYPTCPRGKVPLSTGDVTAQDLLWQYAQRRRAVDAQFAADLEIALTAKGYRPKAAPAEVAQLLGDMTAATMLNRGIAGKLDHAIAAWEEHFDGSGLEWRDSEAGRQEAADIASAKSELARFRGFRRADGQRCACTTEAGDSPCPVHGETEIYPVPEGRPEHRPILSGNATWIVGCTCGWRFAVSSGVASDDAYAEHLATIAAISERA